MTDHEQTLRLMNSDFPQGCEKYAAACLAGAEAIAKVNKNTKELCEYLLSSVIATQKIRLTMDEIVELIDEAKYVFSTADQ